MILKRFKPTSAGSRNKYLLPYHDLKLFNFKPLINYQIVNGGRDNHGRITIRHKGKLSRHFTPLVDYHQTKFLLPYEIVGYKCSKQSTNLIGLIRYINGAFSYILTADETNLGYICNFSDFFVKKTVPGLRVPIGLLKNRFIKFFNVELRPGSGGKIARSGGTSVKILTSPLKKKTLIQLPSKETKIIDNACLVTLGRSSNIFNK